MTGAPPGRRRHHRCLTYSRAAGTCRLVSGRAAWRIGGEVVIRAGGLFAAFQSKPVRASRASG